MMNKFGEQLNDFLEFNNINKKEFAERIDTTPKNLNDILKGKIELSQNMIYNISFVTDIPVSYIENVEKNYRLDKNITNFLNKNGITIKEFVNRFDYKNSSKIYKYNITDERNYNDIAKDILKYLRITNPETIYKENNSIFYKSKNDKPELLALWLERCYKLALLENVKIYNKNNIDNIVKFIKKEALHNQFDEKKLIDEFNNNGIYLVIENDLKSSKIRGAFKVLNNKPAIFITKKHQRYADIYFALLHELAHCKSDFNRAKSGTLISYDNKTIEDYEIKADNTAFNWMVEDTLYDEIKKDYKNIPKDIPLSFVVYRLAHDKIINYSSSFYQNNNKTIS